MAPPPLHLAQPIISRIKVMANLNIAERRLPQDGRIMKKIADKHIDLRVSTLPTLHGESVVLRVLDRSSVNLDLENLGLPEDIFDYIATPIDKPNGIFIVTGPTGAGKTTTLYACLRKINTIDTKLLTAEDPVEYDIDGIIQVPVNEGIGLTFAPGPARLPPPGSRQDHGGRDARPRDRPDRDPGIAHRPPRLLHPAHQRRPRRGDPPRRYGGRAVPRRGHARGVLAQRLLRTICEDCRTSYEPSEAMLAQLGLSASRTRRQGVLHRAGCDTCRSSGYKGRQGLFELLDMTDPIRELITERAADRRPACRRRSNSG